MPAMALRAAVNLCKTIARELAYHSGGCFRMKTQPYHVLDVLGIKMLAWTVLTWSSSCFCKIWRRVLGVFWMSTPQPHISTEDGVNLLKGCSALAAITFFPATVAVTEPVISRLTTVAVLVWVHGVLALRTLSVFKLRWAASTIHFRKRCICAATG